MKLNTEHHPVGTRALVSHIGSDTAFEITVREWSPSGKYVLIELITGDKQWREPEIGVIEILEKNTLDRIAELEARLAKWEACIDAIDSLKVGLYGCKPDEVRVYENGFNAALNKVMAILNNRATKEGSI